MLVTKKFAWPVYFVSNYSCKFFGTPTLAQNIIGFLFNLILHNVKPHKLVKKTFQYLSKTSNILYIFYYKVVQYI